MYWSEDASDDDIETFHKRKQSNWHMPDEYKNLDIADCILSLCKTEAELQRVGQELLLYQERNLFDLLRFMKYLVDTLRKNNIVWGVGRGSSVASYVLYLLGVHKINSMYYDLDITEFLK
jgi:DNA polymerase III alpha subunit